MSGPSLSEFSIAGALLSGYARKLSLTSKPNMEVHIENHFHTKVYSTSSLVAGHVHITSANDLRFDKIQILLLGCSKSRVDGVNLPQITQHIFLKLEMPIPESTYPVPRVLEAGGTYKIPFEFVIPQSLTLSACNHRVSNEPIHAHHVRLPPTMGSWEKDDFAPNMAQVEYSIRARIMREESGENVKLMEVCHPIHVFPEAIEDAPLNITSNDTQYTMSKSKSLRKNIISPKTGKVTVSVPQPKAVMMSADARSASNSFVILDLQYEPSSADAVPPRVTSVNSKITAITYFSTSGIKQFPNLGDWHRFGTDGRGSYSGSVALPSASFESANWKQHYRDQARRDSGYCSDQSDSDSARRSKKNSKRGSPFYYTARVQVPFSLPTDKKTFIPTFHSCITSRAYTLSVSVTLTSASGSTVTVPLVVPLQVGVAPLQRSSAIVDESGLPTFEAAIQDPEVDEFLRPRVLTVPNVDFAHTPLPGYGDVMAGRTVTAH